MKVIYHYESLGNGPADSPIIQPTQIQTQLIPTLQSIFSLVLLLIPGFTFPKISILTLYLRLFRGKFTRILTWIVMGAACAEGLAYFIATVASCQPVAFFWDKTMEPPGHCIDLRLFYRSFGIPNIVIDVFILAIPFPSVWNLHVPTTRKIGLSVLFLTWLIALVASCIRWALYAERDPLVVSPSKYHVLRKGVCCQY